MNKINICLLGDYSDQVLAHTAILASMQIAKEKYKDQLFYQWVQTSDIAQDIHSQFSNFDAVWIVPASPYENTQGVLDVLFYIRTQHIPFLGTCGGYQHALIEYAKNVLFIHDADHAEINSDAINPIILPLSCSLIEKTEKIMVMKDSLLSQIYANTEFEEQFHCSFGFNHHYLNQFKSLSFKFSAFNLLDEVRAFELIDHPFYIGTSFQPERSALKGALHPLVEHFFLSAIKYSVVRFAESG
ncbi:CTP synthase C-terminal region-related (seleno)protein [Acinetobacter piscicola]|uniref:CTP synthase C-terminal region-related (seleno)protein n=1 Tax=Acinetobacter piscicola TaxID=2006115 RepID=UPI000B7E2AFB|nr:hypothetical protein [Acinetobacter piscicola]